MAVEKVWEKLQPCIVAIHEHLSRLFCLELSQPGILSGESRRLVTFINIEDEVYKRRDGASSDCF